MKKLVSLGAIFIVLFFPFWFMQTIGFLILTIYLLSYLYSKITFNNLRITRDQNIIWAYKLQVLNISLILENKSNLPLHYITVSDRTGKLGEVTSSKFIVSMARKQKKRLNYKVKASQRGEYFIGPVVVKFSDPLGLFPWTLKFGKKTEADTHATDCRIIVYPGVFQILRDIHKGYPGGNIKVKNKIYEDITRIQSIREYIPGDDIRHISWKVSAHLGSLYTIEHRQSVTSPVLLLLNLTVEDYPIKYRYSLMESSIEICASLIHFFNLLKQETGLISSGLVHNTQPQIQVQGGKSHSMFLLEMLAIIQPFTEDFNIIDFFNNSRLVFPNGMRVILIGPELHADQILNFTSKQKKNIFLEHIIVDETKATSKHPRIQYFNSSEIRGEVLYV